MHELYELKDKLCEELKEYGSKDLSAGALDVVDKLSHTIKNLDKIIETYEEDDGYSGAYMYDDGGMMDGNRSYRGRSYTGGSYRGGSYRDGMDRSFARGRGSNAKRDSMGRYSSRGYSRNGGMVSELMELMQDAPNEQTRQEFQRLIDKIEQMG